MFGRIGNIANRLIDTLESFKFAPSNRTPDFSAQPFNNASGQRTAINTVTLQFAQGQQTKNASRQPNEWEQKALNKLDELAKANDGYVFTSETTKGLQRAKAEMKRIIAAQKPGQQDRGVSIATFAILNVGNARFKNTVSASIQDANGKKVTIEGSSNRPSYKCNIFIAAALVEGGHVNFKDNNAKGAGFPLIDGKVPATNWMGDKRDTQHLSNLKIVTDGSLKVGDIIAWRNTNPKEDGHSAVYIGGGMVVYSGSSAGGEPKVMTLKELDGNMRPTLLGRAAGLSVHEPYVVRRYSEK